MLCTNEEESEGILLKVERLAPISNARKQMPPWEDVFISLDSTCFWGVTKEHLSRQLSQETKTSFEWTHKNLEHEHTDDL